MDEGHVNLQLPCSRGSTAERLTWYLTQDGQTETVYDTMTEQIQSGYSVSSDSELSHILTILEVTDTYAGEYSCIISKEDPSQGLKYGSASVTSVKGMASNSEHSL